MTDYVMKYNKTMGVSAPEIGWVPSPSFVLRRAAIMDILKNMNKGKAIEIGCGPGGILYELGRMGFQCVGVELSGKSRDISKKILAKYPKINVIESTDNIQQQDFDYLFSFEVLEHIRNDVEALISWVRLLKKDGVVIISVPAHKEKWNVTDLMAGHYRRYDKEDIEKLVTSAGLKITKIQTCGWPISWVIEKIRLLVRSYQIKKSGVDLEKIEIGDVELSKQSGVERNTERRLFKYYGSKIIGVPLFFFLTKVQKLFYKTNLGISYIVVAKKSV